MNLLPQPERGDLTLPVYFAVSQHDAVAGLRALAAELGSRRGRSYACLADQIEQGENPPWFDVTRNACSGGAVQRSSERGLSSLARYAMLSEQRRRGRNQLFAAICLATCYLTAALLVGAFLSSALTPWVEQLESDPLADVKVVRSFVGEYLVTVCFVPIAFIGFISRIWFLAPTWVAKVVNHVPVVGGLLQAIDQAEISESVYQAIAAGHDYASTFMVASQSTRSRPLKEWLTHASQRLSAGESLRLVAETCSIRRGPFAQAMALAVGMKSHRGAMTLWQDASNQAHGEVTRRLKDLTVTLIPLVAVLSALICGMALIQLFGRLLDALNQWVYWWG